MTGRIILGVLFLSGWFICSSCLLHQYHFVNVNMTWTAAQTYCRKNYTDLATIETLTEMNQLINTVSSAGYNSEVWIDLHVGFYGSLSYNIPDDFWKWENQTQNEPYLVNYLCLSMSNTASGVQWSYEKCLLQNQFICDNGTQQVFVNKTMDWFKAWGYCKENFTNLTKWNSTAAQKLVPGGDRAWIGMIRLPYTYWSDGSSSSFSYSDNTTSIYDNIDSSMRGVADLQRSGKFRLLPYQTALPFVCYSSPATKAKKVVRLSMSSTVDLNDAVVKANILTQLQNRLMEKGVSGVTLRWREQPYGKVFYKESQTEKNNNGC